MPELSGAGAVHHLQTGPLDQPPQTHADPRACHSAGANCRGQSTSKTPQVDDGGVVCPVGASRLQTSTCPWLVEHAHPGLSGGRGPESADPAASEGSDRPANLAKTSLWRTLDRIRELHARMARLRAVPGAGAHGGGW